MSAGRHSDEVSVSAVTVGALHAVWWSHTRGGAPALSDAGLRSGEFNRFHLFFSRSEPPADKTKPCVDDLKSCVGNPSPLFTCRPNGSPAAMPSPTLTWTKAACAITPACVSAATLFPADEFTPATLSRWPSGPSATATRTACCLCGREKVRLCEITVMWPLRVSACHWCASAPPHQS